MPVRKLLVVFSCLCVTSGAFGQAPVAAPAPLESGLEPVPEGTTLVSPQFDPGLTDFVGGPNPADLPPIPNSWLNSFWNPQPLVEFRAEVLWLLPDFPDSDPIASQVRQDDFTSFEVYDTRVTATGQYIAAMRAAIEAHISPNLSVEAVGFTMDGPEQRGSSISQSDFTFFLDATATNQDISDNIIEDLPDGFAMDADGNTLRRGFLFNLPDGFPTEAEALTLDWDFETSGADATVMYHWIPLRGAVSDLALGVGGRYLNVKERISVDALDDVDPTAIRTGSLRSRTESDLAGPQLTARARVQGPGRRIRSVAELKIGLMTSDTRVTNSVITNGQLTSQGSYNRTVFGSLFESNFLVEVFATENLTFFGGFQLLYVDRIARSSEQITRDINAFTAEHKALGSLFMFGPRAGVVISY